jgi:hypothetical protein
MENGKMNSKSKPMIADSSNIEDGIFAAETIFQYSIIPWAFE